MALTGVMEVPPADREVLEGWLRSPSIRAGLAQRARIVLLAADGVGTNAIAEPVSHVADAGGSVSEAMHALSRRRI